MSALSERRSFTGNQESLPKYHNCPGQPHDRTLTIAMLWTGPLSAGPILSIGSNVGYSALQSSLPCRQIYYNDKGEMIQLIHKRMLLNLLLKFCRPNGDAICYILAAWDDLTDVGSWYMSEFSNQTRKSSKLHNIYIYIYIVKKYIYMLFL